MFVNLNGKIIPAEEARISVFDRGFLYGDGVFETLRAVKGRIIEIESHISRLYRSAECISVDIPESLSTEVPKERI